MFVIVELEFDQYGYYENIIGVYGPYKSRKNAELNRDIMYDKYGKGTLEVQEIQKLRN
jgi:hypothetical protein